MYGYPASSRIIFSSFPRATLRDKLVSFLLFATLALVSYIPWPSWFLERTRTSVLGLPSHLPIHEDRFSLYAAPWLSMLFPTAYFLLLPLPLAGYRSELVLPTRYSLFFEVKSASSYFCDTPSYDCDPMTCFKVTAYQGNEFLLTPASAQWDKNI